MFKELNKLNKTKSDRILAECAQDAKWAKEQRLEMLIQKFVFDLKELINK